MRVTQRNKRKGTVSNTMSNNLTSYKASAKGKVIVQSAGHGGLNKFDPGAVGLIREHDEAVKLTLKVRDYLTSWGVDTHLIIDTSTRSVNANVNWLSAQHVRYEELYGINGVLHYQTHFNSIGGGTQTRDIGTEALHFSDSTRHLAQSLANAMSSSAGFTNRGAKVRKDLGFLRKPMGKAVLAEVCFVNSKADVDKYRKNFDRLAHSMAYNMAINGGWKLVEKPMGNTPSGVTQKDGDMEMKLTPTQQKDAKKLFGHAYATGVFSADHSKNVGKMTRGEASMLLMQYMARTETKGK